MFANASILITGGTGSFGKAFVGTILKRYPGIKRLVIFSRDELKQFEMAQIWSTSSHKGLRYFLGDVRDSARVARALEGIDYVVHAAALKQVVAAEYNPFEFIQTNIMGANNVINVGNATSAGGALGVTAIAITGNATVAAGNNQAVAAHLLVQGGPLDAFRHPCRGHGL